jgi:hypothetical protein
MNGGSDVITAMAVNGIILRDITPCSPVKSFALPFSPEDGGITFL